MFTSEGQPDDVQTATDSTQAGKNKGALLIAIGAFLLLVVLILTNMK